MLKVGSLLPLRKDLSLICSLWAKGDAFVKVLSGVLAAHLNLISWIQHSESLHKDPNPVPSLTMGPGFLDFVLDLLGLGQPL